MKSVLTIAIALLTATLVACEPTTRETSQDYVLPPELQDCKAYYLRDTNGSSLTVMRCPNSTTATQKVKGKTSIKTVVIDGVTYTKAN